MRSMSKSLTQWLLAVAGEYARARKLSMSSVGFYAVRDAKFLSTDDLGNLVRPGFSLAKLDQAITWFSERWPAGARWPDPPAWPYPIPTTEPGEPNGKASIEGKHHHRPAD